MTKFEFIAFREARDSKLLSSPTEDQRNGRSERGFNDGALTLTLDAYCPNPNCRSIILKHSSAIASEIQPIELPSLVVRDAAGLKAEPLDAESGMLYWVVADMMQFENIGFTKPISQATVERFLSCADCDLGPLGFVSSVKRHFVDVSRLRYKNVLHLQK